MALVRTHTWRGFFFTDQIWHIFTVFEPHLKYCICPESALLYYSQFSIRNKMDLLMTAFFRMVLIFSLIKCYHLLELILACCHSHYGGVQWIYSESSQSTNPGSVPRDQVDRDHRGRHEDHLVLWRWGNQPHHLLVGNQCASAKSEFQMDLLWI